MNVLSPPKPIRDSRRVPVSDRSQSTPTQENSTEQIIEKWIYLSIEHDPYNEAQHASFWATQADQKLTIIKVRAVLRRRVKRLQQLQNN